MTGRISLVVPLHGFVHGAVEEGGEGFALSSGVLLKQFFFALGDAENNTVNLFGFVFFDCAILCGCTCHIEMPPNKIK